MNLEQHSGNPKSKVVTEVQSTANLTPCGLQSNSTRLKQFKWYHCLRTKNSAHQLTISPRPSIEKCPEWWRLGNTNFPGSESLGASLATPPMWNFLAAIATGFSAGRVATCWTFQHCYKTTNHIVFQMNGKLRIKYTDLDHNVCTKYVWRKKYPKHIIYEKSRQQQCWHFQTRQSYKSYECYA